MKMIGHDLYFFEDFLLPPPHTYCLIDFKVISSTILAKVGGQSPSKPLWLRHWPALLNQNQLRLILFECNAFKQNDIPTSQNFRKYLKVVTATNMV